MLLEAIADYGVLEFSAPGDPPLSELLLHSASAAVSRDSFINGSPTYSTLQSSRLEGMKEWIIHLNLKKVVSALSSDGVDERHS